MPVVKSSEEDKQPEQTEPTLDATAALENETSVSKSNGSANNSFDNMESLLVNEDEDDDPMGTVSLLMSGSEGEEGENISPVRRNKRAPRILDSEDEDGAKQEENINEKAPDDEEDREGDSEIEHNPYKPQKFSALIDSDSEPEMVPEEENSDRLKGLIDSDNADDESREEKIKQTTKKSKKVKKAKNISRSPKMGSDSEDEGEESSKSKKKSKISNLIDSDSESSIASDEENEQGTQSQEREEGDASAQRPKKQQRASAKKAMNEMQAIQSESQRLYRETQVSIPYHKPKRHTLKEFLTRHTIAKPQVGEGGSGKRLKMSPEELEAYAKHLEDRAKEATEFFKSESEEELEDIAQEDHEKEKEEPFVLAKPVAEFMELEEPSEVIPPSKDDIDNLVESGATSLPTTQELIDLEMPQESELLPEPIATTSTAVINRETQPVASRLFDLKRRLIAEKNLPATPTLKGGPNMMIDFESGDIVPSKPTGLESLFQRFVKSNMNNKKPKESTLMIESVLDKPKMSVSVIEEPNKEKEPKPGAAYVKLKESLRTLITKKRKEDFQKRMEETQEEELEYKKCCGLDDDDDEDDEDAKERESRPKRVNKDIMIDDEENEIELLNDGENDEEECEDVDEPCENNEEVIGTEETNENGENADNSGEEDEVEVDAEDDAAEVDAAEEDEEDDSDSDEEQANNDPLTRKHRVITAFEDSDDEKDELGTDLNATSTSVLFAEEEEKNPEEVENELLGLCSGQFEESQRTPLISQIPITQTPGIAEDTELMNLCSGAFNEEFTQKINELPKEKQKTVTKILSSDEEEKELEAEKECINDTKKVKKLKKKQKKRAKLGFSDDEDNSEEEQNLQDPYEEEEEEIPQTFIDYDSEENEIEVQMSKKDCLKQANAFLEKEAELSESEWGSADEDEQNLDKYDIELGDEDEFDREKIRAELGQIHMRKVLDDDIREVKKIQEMLFEDEEADGVGRQRQFRWKNIENGFSLDDPAGGGPDNEDGIDSADDEEEMKWRKMRFDREQLLKQKTKEEILAEVSATVLGRTLLSTMEPDIESNLVYEPEVLVEKEYKAPSFLIAQCDVKSMKGSFLNYDKETLAKIAAAATKSGVQNEDEQMQHKASKTGNFVFAPLSEEEQALRKRKAEKAQNAASGNAAKKLKPNSGKSLLLDKLL